MGSPIVRQRPQRLDGEWEAIAHAVDTANRVSAFVPPGGTGIGEGNEVAAEIAAVDGRNVDRLERAKVQRVVPVEEVAPVALQAIEGREGCLEPFDGLQRTRPAELTGRGGGQEQQPDVGWRRPMSKDGIGILLEVVGRQHVVGRRHERFEEAPGTPRCRSERPRIGH